MPTFLQMLKAFNNPLLAKYNIIIYQLSSCSFKERAYLEKLHVLYRPRLLMCSSLIARLGRNLFALVGVSPDITLCG